MPELVAPLHTGPPHVGGRGSGQQVLQAPAIEVSDQLERRIRKPADALRFTLVCIAIVLLVLAGLGAANTAAAVQLNIYDASKKLPHALLEIAPQAVNLLLYILPLSLGISQLVRRQPRRLIEAVATGALAALVAHFANVLLEQHFASPLYHAIIMQSPATPNVNTLDSYLVGMVAFATMIGLTGRPGWRNGLILAVCLYAVVQVTAAHLTNASILTILLTVLVGHAIALAVRYGFGSASQRPSARDIAAALSTRRAGRAKHDKSVTVTAIRRVQQPRAEAPWSRQYAVTTQDGSELDAVVFDRDQQAAGVFYQLYRWIRVRGQVSHTAPLTLDRAVERRALLTYASEDAGVPTPRLRTLARVGPDAAVLAYDHCEGVTLAERGTECTDEELGLVWDAVSRLHAHHVAHRWLTADRIVFTAEDRVMLLDPGDGDVAASDLQLRLDLAQLIAELALVVGPERSAKLAVERIDGDELVAVVALLQTVALVRTTRRELRGRRGVLSAVRKALIEALPDGEVTPVQLQRIRPRTLVTLVAVVFAVYLLAGDLAGRNLYTVLSGADWRWGLAALGLSAATYVGASLSVSGWVTEHLSFFRTTLVQLASSYIALMTPAAVGGAALNVRYLQRKKVPAPAAVASVGVSQVVAFALHIALLAIFGVLTGVGATKGIENPPVWSYFVGGAVIALAGVVLALPAGRRLVRARLSPTFGQVLPRLVEIGQRPAKLAEGIGGALLLSLAYILCLAASVAAFGGSIPIAKIGFVYLTASVAASIIPTPGGLGAVETALTTGLVLAGMQSPTAFSAVLLFRILSFWLPIPVGWFALNYLERHRDL
jgi:glycosyltransferase 2 family protein